MSDRKVALVTGGSRGIGRGCALELARAGYDIAINFAGNEEAANKTVEDIKALGVDAEAIKFDVTKVKHAAGIAPIAPIDPDGLKAMGKTNDAVLFGGRTYYYVESDENDDIADVAAKLPSSAADGYGKPFFDVFKEAEFDFYKIDKGMFAPAEVVINYLTTGKIYKEGYVNVDLLKKSFGLDE